MEIVTQRKLEGTYRLSSVQPRPPWNSSQVMLSKKKCSKIQNLETRVQRKIRHKKRLKRKLNLLRKKNQNWRNRKKPNLFFRQNKILIRLSGDISLQETKMKKNNFRLKVLKRARKSQRVLHQNEILGKNFLPKNKANNNWKQNLLSLQQMIKRGFLQTWIKAFRWVVTLKTIR